MEGGTVAATSTRALLAACAKLGTDTDALLAAAGVDRARLEAPEARLPGDVVSRIWREAFERTGAPDLAVQAALSVPFGAYRVIDFLAASAPTLGEGLVRVARYFPLINSGVELRVHRDGDEHRVELTSATPIPKPYAEFALTVTVIHSRRANSREWPLLRATFAYPPSPSADALSRALGCPVRFGEPRTEFVFSDEVWRQPSEAASTDLLRTLEELADRMLRELESGELEARVTRLLLEALRGGDPSLEAIARKLGMSGRTLQRRLTEEGSSFAAILDRTRKSFAECYVRQGTLALSEIAYLLGFSEQSAFTRAFTRWHGVPPTAFRSETTAV